MDHLLTDDEDAPPPLRTSVTQEKARTIITRNNSPDIGFDQSINAYRGCEHGCIYCFARPSHARLDLSPGLDFESKLFVKPEAARLLRKELARPGYVVKTIAMGTNTDPYQPIEEHWQITRQIIEILAACRHPMMITTKSDRVVRDIDLLAPMAAQGLVAVALSVTTPRSGHAPQAGAARAASGQKAGGNPGAECGRHSRPCLALADDPGDQRP